MKFIWEWAVVKEKGPIMSYKWLEPESQEGLVAKELGFSGPSWQLARGGWGLNVSSGKTQPM